MGNAFPPMQPSTAFTFRAVRPDGAEESGRVEATSRDAALARLAERNLLPYQLQPARTAHASPVRGKRLPVSELAIGLRILGTLLEAELPLYRAVLILGDLAPSSWAGALPSIRDSIAEGQRLAGAFAASSLRLPNAVVGMLEAAEANGRLPEGVRAAAQFSERNAATANAIRAALAYPLLLCIVGGTAIALLTGVVIPRFATILGDLGESLPPSTRLVLGVAQELRTSGPVLGGALLVSLAAVAAWLATPRGRAHWHRALLAIPVVGTVRWSGAAERCCSALAALIETGLPISTAIPYAARASGDLEIQRRLLAGRENIVAGQGIGDALQLTNALPPATVRLIRAGEESGKLPAMLNYASRIEGDRAQRTIASSVRLLEPVLIIFFAGLVTLVAAALLQAIYSIRPSAV